jgi:hypothetical protein
MTTQRPNSRLDDWSGPVFPELTPRLITALQALPQNQRSGPGIRSRLGGLVGLEGVTEQVATDGYTWPTVVMVSVHGGVIAVALPHASLDRSPAVYTKGEHVTDATADAIMARVIRALRPNPGRRSILTGP